jgi:hypothetical protein
VDSTDIKAEEILDRACGSDREGKTTNECLARQATGSFIKNNFIGKGGKLCILQEILVLAARCYHDGFLDGIAQGSQQAR